MQHRLHVRTANQQNNRSVADLKKNRHIRNMKVIQRGRGDHRTLEESRLSSASHRVGKTKKTSAEGMKDYIRRINDEKLSTAKNQSNYLYANRVKLKFIRQYLSTAYQYSYKIHFAYPCSSRPLSSRELICTAIVDSDRVDYSRLKVTPAKVSFEALKQIKYLYTKIHKLLTNKLSMLSSNKKKNKFSYTNSDEVYQELKSLLDQLAAIRGGDYDSVNDGIELVDRKINIIECLLAYKNINSYMIKYQYFARKAARATQIALCMKSKLKAAMSKSLTNFKEKNYNLISQVLSQPFLDCDTSNRTGFKRPQLEAYRIYRHKKYTYSPNRISVPFSSYQNDFLPLKNVMSISYRPVDTFSQYRYLRNAHEDRSLNLSTCYNRDYNKGTEAKKNRFDYKEMDCFRNKHLNLAISFIDHSRKPPLAQAVVKKSTSYLTLKSKEAMEIQNLGIEPTSNRNGDSNKFKTATSEQRRYFIDFHNPCNRVLKYNYQMELFKPVSSKPKQANLYFLTRTFRNCTRFN